MDMDDATEVAIIAEEEALADTTYDVVRTDDGKFVCPLCAQLFRNKVNCVNHLTNDHGVEVPSTEEEDVTLNECSYCGSTFRWKKNLYKHIRSNHDAEPEDSDGEKEGPFKCLYCRVPFTSISNLNRHCRTKHYSHGMEPPPPIVTKAKFCPMCNQKFCSEASLQCHTRLFHKVVVVSSGSNFHRKMRGKFYEFSCKICNLKLNKRFNMNRHVTTAHGVEPNSQTVSTEVTCMFGDKEEVIEAFGCKDCDQQFSNESNWASHMKTTHDMQPETCCYVCGAHSFQFMRDLQLHLQDVHSIPNVTIDEDRQFVRLHKSTLGLQDSEIHALAKIPKWLVKRANGQLVIAVHRS